VAFTDDNKARIRMYLGYQARFAQFDSVLERALSALDGAEFAAEQALVLEHLAECIRIDAAIVTAERRIKARTVGTIGLNGREIEDLRDRGRTEVARMARALGVPVRGDAFGQTLEAKSASPWGAVGGGNQQRQG
jgi:hypothetical protein